MNDIWSLDTEDDSKGRVYLINFYDGNRHYTFRDKKSAVQWLTKKPRDIQIWCTNLGYDLINLFGDDLQVLEISYVGGRVISAKIANSKIKFRDTLNHWKISVEDMGKRIGLKKLKTKRGNFDDVEYCKRDSEITWRFVHTMSQHYASIGAKLKPTIGSTALAYFFDHYSSRPRKALLSEKKIEFCMGGYYGGRTEIFFNKPVEGRIFYFDINSLYPHAMLRTYPTLRGSFWTKTPNFNFEGMVDVTLFCPRMSIPYLPNRLDSGRLVFPCGNFRGTYTYFEIREAKKLGYEIKKIHRALEFTGRFKPFSEFVARLYDERLKAQAAKDDLLADTYKLIMNNLYGKFGQGREYEKLVPITSKQTLKTGDTIFGNLVLKKIDDGYPVHSNGIWACYTTAYARHELYGKLTKVEKEKALLIYCDTDSIVFEHRRPIFAKSTDLGGVKCVGEFEYGHFKLPKLYALRARGEKTSYKAKGISRARGCDREKYAREFFEKGRTKFRRPYKLKETLRRNLSPKRTEKLIANFWDVTHKELKQVYDKRIVHRDGSTEPLILGNCKNGNRRNRQISRSRAQVHKKSARRETTRVSKRRN